MSENNTVQIKEAAQQILSNEVVERHSIYQLQCFVLAKEPTIQGKLHQCLREIKAKKRSLDSLELEIEEQSDKLDLLDLDIAQLQEKEVEDFYDEKRKEIKLRSLNRKAKALKANIEELKKKEKDISEELLFFCSAFGQLSHVEKLKSWDDVDVQKAYWSEKLRFEVNTRLLLRQLPDIELMKTIMCLHDDAPIKQATVKMLKNMGEQQQPALTQNQG